MTRLNGHRTERDLIIDDLLALLWAGVRVSGGERDPHHDGVLAGLTMAVAVVEHGLDTDADAVEVRVLLQQGKRIAHERGPM